MKKFDTPSRAEMFQKMDDVSRIMRRASDGIQDRFDIDSKIYRADLYEDFSLFCSHVDRPDIRILDLGCGKGHHTAVLSSLGFTNMAGLDLPDTSEEGGVFNAASLGPKWQLPFGNAFSEKFGIDFGHYDGVTVPYSDKSFDHLLLYAVIEHVEDEGLFLSECRRILKPGGKVFVYRCPNRLSYAENLAKVLGMGHHDRMYGKSGLLNLFSRHGFRNIHLERYDHFPSFFPIKRYQDNYDVCVSHLGPLSRFLSSAPLLNLFSHHYRGVFVNDNK